MDAKQIRQLKPMLTRYLRQFDDCFARRDTRAHFSTYVEGQLSDLGEKSCEPIALAAGIPPRNLQEFLSTYKWEEDRTRNRLQEIVIRDHSARNSVGIIDETSDVKQGNKTPGVKRQWCGTVGKTENCIVTVHLAYATGDFHCLLDGDLFLPEDWSNDRARCRAAGIPDDVVYRPKWKIALELFDRARDNGVAFDWLTFDEGYGGKPEFLRELHGRKQCFVGEVPTTFTGWIHAAARHRPAVSASQGTRPQDAANGRRQPASHQRREHAQILAGTAGSRVGAVSCQRWREGADGLGGEARSDYGQGREGLARNAAAPGGRSQCVGPDGGQVLSQQRSIGNERANLVAGGVLALACRTVLRGPKTGSRTRSMGRASLAGIETTPHSDIGELLVLGASPRETAGEKIQS